RDQMTSPRALGNDLLSAIDRPVQKARWGTLVLFLLHGLIVGTWISRIPAFQIALKLNNAVLGLTLVSATIGAILSDSCNWQADRPLSYNPRADRGTSPFIRGDNML